METSNNFKSRKNAIGSDAIKAVIAEGIRQRGERRTMERITTVLNGVNYSFVDQLHTWSDSLEGQEYWSLKAREERHALNMY